jgi:hypothetical protein
MDPTPNTPAPVNTPPVSEAPTTPGAIPTTPPASTPPATPPKIEQIPTAKDLSPFTKEFAEKGSLSPESYTKLQSDWGLPKDVVDSYIEGQKARSQAFTQSIHSEVGGAEQYKQMTEWARQNLPQAEKETFNAAIDSADEARVRFAVAALKSRYVAAVGQAPNLLSGRPAATGPLPFQSKGEMVRAINDPRYRSDSAYRAEVEARIGHPDSRTT